MSSLAGARQRLEAWAEVESVRWLGVRTRHRGRWSNRAPALPERVAFPASSPSR